MKTVLRKNNCLATIGKRPIKMTDDDKWNEMKGNAIVDLDLALADDAVWWRKVSKGNIRYSHKIV